jgi:hypothetical protein
MKAHQNDGNGVLFSTEAQTSTILFPINFHVAHRSIAELVIATSSQVCWTLHWILQSRATQIVHTHTHTHTQSHVTNHNNDIIVFPFSMFATLGICEELRKNFYKRQTDRCVSKFQQVQHHKRNTLPINSTPQITPSVGESILSCIFDNDNSFTSNPSNPGVAGILSCIESSTGLALL